MGIVERVANMLEPLPEPREKPLAARAGLDIFVEPDLVERAVGIAGDNERIAGAGRSLRRRRKLFGLQRRTRTAR